MEELEKYLNKCYLEKDKDHVFIYKLIKENNKYGIECWEAQIKPEKVYIYKDFSEDQKDSTDFIKSFIPELNRDCIAKRISEEYYFELMNKIVELKAREMIFQEEVNKFVKDGLEKEV